jgi:hypothetical protein
LLDRKRHLIFTAGFYRQRSSLDVHVHFSYICWPRHRCHTSFQANRRQASAITFPSVVGNWPRVLLLHWPRADQVYAGSEQPQPSSDRSGRWFIFLVSLENHQEQSRKQGYRVWLRCSHGIHGSHCADKNPELAGVADALPRCVAAIPLPSDDLFLCTADD